MDKQEYESWMRETEGSKQHWQMDEVTRHNTGDYLLYIGGTDGQFIRIENGVINIGNYEGAIPHIMESLFTVGYTSKQYRDNDEALSKLTVALGSKFLLDLLGMRVYIGRQPEWLKRLADGEFHSENGKEFPAKKISQAFKSANSAK